MKIIVLTVNILKPFIDKYLLINKYYFISRYINLKDLSISKNWISKKTKFLLKCSKKEKERIICSRFGNYPSIGLKCVQDDYGTVPPGGNQYAWLTERIETTDASVTRTDKILIIFFILFYPPKLILNLPFWFTRWLNLK